MQHKHMSHPLDKLINDDSLFLMEAIIPFVDSSLRKPLVLYIKTTELRLILDSLNNADYIKGCGFNKNLNNQEEVLASLSECGFSDIARQMESMKKAMHIMNMMNTMNISGTPGMSDMPNMPGESDYKSDSMSSIMELLHEYDTNYERNINE